MTVALSERDLDLALARLHLRTGSLGLARAELEALAGRSRLDERALADLAEARWRTGDLSGAGEAAQAHLAAGGSAPIALVIAAEAIAALGRPTEARSLAGRAIEGADTSLDALFAGMPRSPIWPPDSRRPDSPHADSPPADARPTEDGATPPVPVPNGVGETGVDPKPDASVRSTPSEGELALDRGRAALHAGDTASAAIQLAVALRLSQLLAPAVLDLASAHRTPALDLVRGDALNALGHDSEARQAWAEAAAGARD